MHKKNSSSAVGGFLPSSSLKAMHLPEYGLTYSDASLVSDNNLPAMQETWVRSLGGEDPLEKGMATHSSGASPVAQQ